RLKRAAEPPPPVPSATSISASVSIDDSTWWPLIFIRIGRLFRRDHEQHSEGLAAQAGGLAEACDDSLLPGNVRQSRHRELHDRLPVQIDDVRRGTAVFGPDAGWLEEQLAAGFFNERTHHAPGFGLAVAAHPIMMHRETEDHIEARQTRQSFRRQVQPHERKPGNAAMRFHSRRDRLLLYVEPVREKASFRSLACQRADVAADVEQRSVGCIEAGPDHFPTQVRPGPTLVLIEGRCTCQTWEAPGDRSGKADLDHISPDV